MLPSGILRARPRDLAHACLLLTVVACAYPRRTTSLVPAADDNLFSPPDDVIALTIVSAEVPINRRGASGWDDNGNPPDPYARVYRGEELVFETRTVSDTLRPEWNQALPRNFWAPRNTTLRFEVWDSDGVLSDPAGRALSDGLPATVATGAESQILLDSGGTLTIRADVPRAYRGVGIPAYEEHEDSFVILEVMQYSPAGRAQLRVGDSIVAIDGRRIGEIGAAQGGSALSLLGTHGGEVTIVRGGQTMRVELDTGFTWLTM